ncbi:MAG: Rieske (2Fe-2S) protein [Planctomycetota bacterium]
MRGWTRALPVDAIAPGDGAIVELRGVPVALYRIGDHYHALHAICPHAGSLISEFMTDAGTAMCPSHGWEFNIGDGQCTSHRSQMLRKYPVTVRDGFVWVKVRSTIAMIQDILSKRPGEARRLR